MIKSPHTPHTPPRSPGGPEKFRSTFTAKQFEKEGDLLSPTQVSQAHTQQFPKGIPGFNQNLMPQQKPKQPVKEHVEKFYFPEGKPLDAETQKTNQENIEKAF